MPFASPYHQVKHLHKRTFQHVQHIKPAAYRDGDYLKKITIDFRHGDEQRPHMITAAPFILSVQDDGARRFHPTREIDRYFELGRPMIYVAGEWQPIPYANAHRKSNRISWKHAKSDMNFTMAGHYLKQDIELKNGYIPPDHILGFPFDLVGYQRQGGQILDRGRPVLRLRAPEVYDAADPTNRKPIPHHFVRAAGKWLILFNLPAIRDMIQPVIDPTFETQPAAAAGKDTYLNTLSVLTNYGTNALLAMDAAVKHALIEFDLSSIPADATCDSATLSLWTAGVAAAVSHNIFSLHSAVATWEELTTTWLNYKTGTAWPGSAGASTSGTDHEASQIGTLTNETTIHTETSAALTAARVEDWFGSPNSNYGIIIGVTGSASARNYHSSDAATAAYRPKLVVEYTLATPPTSTFALSSSLIL